MSQHSSHRPMVVVAVDGSPDADRAIAYAVGEAHRRGAGLRLVHVQPQTVMMAPMMPMVPAVALHEVAASVVKESEEVARRSGWTGPGLEAVLANGPRTSSLLEHAADAVCLVVGRRHSVVGHVLSGSTTSSLAAHARVPVLCVPASGDGTEGVRVVAGVDSVETLEEILAAGLEEARVRNLPLQIVHAWRPTGQYDAAIGLRALQDDWAGSVKDTLTRRVHELALDSDVEWTVSPRYEAAATALHSASRTAALVVVGRHGHTGWSARHLGATVRALLRTAECPVLVVPTPQHA